MSARTKICQSAQAAAAHRKLGLATAVLRITRDAVLTSVLRYGLALLGSRLPEDLAGKVDVQIVDVAARRLAYRRPSARIET